MKIIVVISAVLLLFYTVSCKPTSNDDYDPNYEEDDPTMQKDDTDTDYGDDNSDNEEGEDDAVPKIITKPQHIIVAAHDEVLLRCDMDMNADTYVIMWKKEDKIIYQDTIILSGFPASKFILQNTSLLIKDVTDEDSGEYTCIIMTNPLGPQVKHTLKVMTPPKIEGIHTAKNLNEYKVGDTLSLTCRVSGIPEPNVTWSLKGNRFDERGKTLIIENIGHDNGGIYQCFAENGVGQPAHEVINIKVNHKPIVRIEKLTSPRSSEDYDVELRCIVHSIPDGIVTWRKDGEDVKGDNIKSRKKNTVHSLIISKVTKENFGKYSCRAVNQEGTNEQYMVLTNVPSQPLHIKSERSKESNEVTIQWEVESVSPISEYLLQYKLKTVDAWINEKPEVTNADGSIYKIQHTIGNLGPGEYEVRVKAMNVHGWSEESKLITITVRKHHHGHKKHQHTTYEDEANEQTVAHETRVAVTAPGSSSALAPTSTILCLLAAVAIFNRH